MGQAYYNEYPTAPTNQQKQSLPHFLGDNASGVPRFCPAIHPNTDLSTGERVGLLSVQAKFGRC